MRAAPSGALTKLTEIVPSAADFIEIAEEVRWLAPLRCAHPPVMREEPNSSKGRTKRKLVAPPPKLYAIFMSPILLESYANCNR